MPKTTPRRRKSANPFLDAAESLIESFARSLVQNIAPPLHSEVFCHQCRAFFLVSFSRQQRGFFCPKCGEVLSFSPDVGLGQPKPIESKAGPTMTLEEAKIWLAREAGLLDYITRDDDILDKAINQASKALHARKAPPEEFLRLQQCVETIRKK